MASLAEEARRAARQCVELLDRATEEGDAAEAVAESLRTGHILFLIAASPSAWVSAAIAAHIRGSHADPAWPPVLAITDDTGLLALVGCGYETAEPLRRQAELLVAQGDAAVLLGPCGVSAQLRDAAQAAAAQGAVVVSLGTPPSGVEARASIALPDAQPAQLARCQLALGHALAAGLAARLPVERPSDVEPALLSFRCPNCGSPFAVPRRLAGRHGTCPHCYGNLTLPSAGGAGEDEGRAHLRFALRECTLAVSLAQVGEPALAVPGQTQLTNLSRGGLLFVTGGCPVEIQPGDSLLIDIATPAFEHPLRVACSAVRVTREAARQHVGVVFGELPPAVAERLRLLERTVVLRSLAARPAPAAPGPSTADARAQG